MPNSVNAVVVIRTGVSETGNNSRDCLLVGVLPAVAETVMVVGKLVMSLLLSLRVMTTSCVV